MSNYAITSIGNYYPLSTEAEVNDVLNKFSSLKEEYKSEAAKNIYKVCNEMGIMIPNNSEVYRFISLKEDAEDLAEFFDCDYYYVSNQDSLDYSYGTFKDIDIMSLDIRKAIERSEIFKSSISLNANNGIAKTFMAFVYSCVKVRDSKDDEPEFMFVKLGTIEVTYYNAYTFSFEVKAVFDFDKESLYKRPQEKPLPSRDLGDALNESTSIVDFFCKGDCNTKITQDITEFPLNDKEEVLGLIGRFNDWVGSKWENDVAYLLVNKIHEMRISPEDIRRVVAFGNQFEKFFDIRGYELNLSESLKPIHTLEGKGYYACEKKLENPKRGSIEEEMTWKTITDAIKDSKYFKEVKEKFQNDQSKRNFDFFIYTFNTKEFESGPWTPVYEGIVTIYFYDLDKWKEHEDNFGWEWGEREELRYDTELNQIVNLNEDITSNVYYHISSQNLNHRVLRPRLPEDNELVELGIENSTTPRVCLGSSIENCLRAICSRIETGDELYVHITTNNFKTYKPTVEDVPDVMYTNEVWSLDPVTLKTLGKIKIGKQGTEQFFFKVGDKEHFDCDYEYEWIEKYTSENKTLLSEAKALKHCQYKNCPKCGSDQIGVFFMGEPIYKCKECGEYLGTVPFPSKKEDIDRKEILDKAVQVLTDLGFKPNVDKESSEKFINNELTEFRGNLCIAGLGNDGLSKACTEVNRVIKPLGGRLSPDNYGTAFLSVKNESATAGIACAPVVNGVHRAFQPHTAETPEAVRTAEELYKNVFAIKNEERIISLSEELVPNEILNENPIFKSTKTLFGLKRVRVNNAVFERYSSELNAIGFDVSQKDITNHKGEILLDDNNNIKACVLTYTDYHVRGVRFNALTFIYVDKSLETEVRSKKEWYKKLLNIAENSYMVQIFLVNRHTDWEAYNELTEVRRYHKIAEEKTGVVTITNSPELAEEIHFVLDPSIEGGKLYDRPVRDENLITDASIPAKNSLGVRPTLAQLGTSEGVYNDIGLWNPIVKHNWLNYRERVEVLIFNEDKTEVYMAINMNRCRIPGGGTMPTKLIEDQLIAECQEEARINIKDLTYIGKYTSVFNDTHKEIYDHRVEFENVSYYGSLTYLFVAQYDSKYTGHIDPKDKDDIITEGKFHDINTVLSSNIRPEWQYAIMWYKSLEQPHYSNLLKTSINGSLHFEDYVVETDKRVYNESYSSLEVLTEAESTALKAKREKIEKYIYGFFNLIDNTGRNTEKYKAYYSKMSDKQFFTEIESMLKDDKKQFYVEMLPNLNEPTLKTIKMVADYLNIELDEYIYYRHDIGTSKPERSAYKVPVGELQVKRLRVKRFYVLIIHKGIQFLNFN